MGKRGTGIRKHVARTGDWLAGYKPTVAPAVKRYVRKAIDKATEDKFITYPLHTYWGSISSGWNEKTLSILTQGDGTAERIGNRIKIKSVEIRGMLVQGSNNGIADDAYNVVRIALATWNNKQDTPCASSVLTVDSPINTLTNGKGYLRKKYLDKWVSLNVASDSGDGTGYIPTTRIVKYYKKFKTPLTIQFSDDTNDYVNQTLVLSMCSDSIAASNPGFENGYVFVRYEDA